MSNSAIGKIMPLYLKFAKDFLQFLDDSFDGIRPTSDLQIINMFGHYNDHCAESGLGIVEMVVAQFRIDRATYQLAFAFRDLT